MFVCLFVCLIIRFGLIDCLGCCLFVIIFLIIYYYFFYHNLGIVRPLRPLPLPQSIEDVDAPPSPEDVYTDTDDTDEPVWPGWKGSSLE